MDPRESQHQPLAEEPALFVNGNSNAAKKRRIEQDLVVPHEALQAPLKHLSHPSQYPRKRVSVACEICRVRKTRCDAARPSCSFCSSLGVACEYRKPHGVIANLMTRAKQGERFQTLQNRLETLEHVLTVSKIPPAPSSDGRGASASSSATVQDFSPSTRGIELPSISSSLVATPSDRQMSTEADHQLPLLGLARALGNLSRLQGKSTPIELRLLDYDDCEHFMETELHQGDLIYQAANKDDVDLSHRACWSYQQSFVKDVLPWFPIFSQDACVEHVSKAQAADFANQCPSTPIALYVLALGAFAKADHMNGDDPHDFPGLNYFAAAREIAGPNGIQHAMEVVQSQILRTLYYCMCMRPLAAVESILPASRALVSLLHLKRHLSQDCMFRQACHRAYWACYIIEKELRPYSAACTPGFEALCEMLPLPLSNHDEPGMLWFLSEIALRRIFVNVGGSETHTTYEPVVTDEICGQLFRWYEGLPPGIRFGQGHAPILDPQKAFLRAQFYSVLFVSKWSSIIQLFTQNATKQRDPVLLEGASQALEYGILYIQAVESSVNERHVLLFANFIGTFCIACCLLCLHGTSELNLLRPVDIPTAVAKAYRILWPWRANPNVGSKLHRLDVMLAEKDLPPPV